jgi:hypothetical protein
MTVKGGSGKYGNQSKDSGAKGSRIPVKGMEVKTIEPYFHTKEIN